jgi:hypothetical protein
MFTALIIFCALQTGECQIVRDVQSPHKTEAECIARLEEVMPFAVMAWNLAYPDIPATVAPVCKQDQEI